MKLSARRLVATLFLVFGVVLLYAYYESATTGDGALGLAEVSTPSLRRHYIEEAFRHTWQQYAAQCMGHDTLNAVTGACEDDLGGYGATTFDSLTTAIMFDDRAVTREILDHVLKVNFTQATDGVHISVAETTIRHLASMLSAYDLLRGPGAHLVYDASVLTDLRQRILDLADVLTCAFITPTGLPRKSVNPTTCLTDGVHRTTLADAASHILEFSRLSDVVGYDVYGEMSRKAMHHLLKKHPENYVPFKGMMGDWVRIKDAAMLRGRGGWGSGSDAFYEYVLKAHVYDPETHSSYLDRWNVVAGSTLQRLSSHPHGRPDLTFLYAFNGQNEIREMDAIAWTAGASIILGGMFTRNQTMVDLGISLADTLGALHEMTAIRLLPESMVWTPLCDEEYSKDFHLDSCNATNVVQFMDPAYRLRPHAFEAWYYAYRATKNLKYREWTWSAWVALNKHCRTANGFAGIGDVMAIDGGEKSGSSNGTVVAEMMKYVWLIHEDDSSPYHAWDGSTNQKVKWVYNTSGHPFSIPEK